MLRPDGLKGTHLEFSKGALKGGVRLERWPVTPEVASSSLVGPATCYPRFPLIIERFPSFYD